MNYENLNDVEFEYLCQDVMSRKLGIHLERFASGPDGGVDLTDDAFHKNTIVQVKHYIRSSVSALITSLKKEVPKVEKHKPKQYYIFCSQQLSVEKKSEIYQLFSAYMEFSANIVTRTEIDNFLAEEENADILRKHFKLWIESTNILQNLLSNDLFIDCEALLADIEFEKNLFVETSAYREALSVLQKNNALILLGNPGVGKTMTSKMLVLYYASEGYRIRYTTDGANLTNLKKGLSASPAEKEVILLDDCFGQIYFKMKDSQETELLQLIKYVKLHPNKI